MEILLFKALFDHQGIDSGGRNSNRDQAEDFESDAVGGNQVTGMVDA
jgi:hypothetical protein